MKHVWIVEGWFGAGEWIESVWADEQKARDEVARLWKDRRSDYLNSDDYRQGVCKFDAVRHEVRT